MKIAFVLPLLLLVSAAPATRPAATAAANRMLVQVRHVVYTLRPGEPALIAGTNDVKIPADTTERSSLQVTAEVGVPFETVAVLNGTTYRLAGELKQTSLPADRISVKIDYSESSGELSKSISRINSTITTTIDQPMPIGGITSDTAASAMILAVTRP